MKNEVPCGIIKDLLFGYTKNILSDEGNKLVKDHISKCECCKKEYDLLNSELDINTNEKVQFNYLKKINLRFVLILRILITLLAIIIVSNIVYIIYSEPIIGGRLFLFYLLILI